MAIYKEDRPQLERRIALIDSPDQVGEALYDYIQELKEKYKGDLTLPQARVALPMLEALKQAFASVTVINNIEFTMPAMPVASDEKTLSLFGFSVKQAQAVLIFGIFMASLFSVTSSLTAAVVFAQTAGVLGLEIYRFFKLDRKAFSQNPYQAKANIQIKIDLKLLFNFFTKSLEATDQAVAEIPPPAPPLPPPADQEMLACIQKLISSRETENPEIYRSRLEELEQTLWTLSFRLVKYRPNDPRTPGEWFEFEKSIDPNLKKLWTQIPALTRNDELILPGKVIEP